MRLSTKFFCIAYVIVLLATGITGIVVIKRVTDMLWETRIQQVQTATKHAADSWLSFADISSETILDSQKDNVLRQIRRSLDPVVSKLDISIAESFREESDQRTTGTGRMRLYEKDGASWLESVCRLYNGIAVYRLEVHSDVSELQTLCVSFWDLYGIVVFGIAVAGGTILYVVAKKTSAPINALAILTKDIAQGNYGKKIKIKTSDYEIVHLSENFNSMTDAICKKINDISEETNRRDRFVANFTHELKTPMTAIIGYSQMLREYDLSPSEQKEASKAIFREAKRLEKLSIQLLDLYVLRNDELQTERISLEQLAWQLQTTLSYGAKKYRVSLSVELHQGWVLANSVLLLSLFYNLADNAFKASAPGGVVRIFSIQESDTFRLFVEDHGRGISGEHLPLLTEPFYREDKSRSRKLGGAGLGLSLCKEIARLHGTALAFESEPGKGTVVSFPLMNGGQ